MGVWVGGLLTANFSHISKDGQKSTSSHINIVTEGDREKMVSNEKLTKTEIRG